MRVYIYIYTYIYIYILCLISIYIYIYIYIYIHTHIVKHLSGQETSRAGRGAAVGCRILFRNYHGLIHVKHKNLFNNAYALMQTCSIYGIIYCSVTEYYGSERSFLTEGSITGVGNHTYMYLYMHMHVHVYIYVYIYIYVCMHIYIYIQDYTHLLLVSRARLCTLAAAGTCQCGWAPAASRRAEAERPARLCSSTLSLRNVMQCFVLSTLE